MQKMYVEDIDDIYDELVECENHLDKMRNMVNDSFNKIGDIYYKNNSYIFDDKVRERFKTVAYELKDAFLDAVSNYSLNICYCIEDIEEAIASLDEEDVPHVEELLCELNDLEDRVTDIINSVSDDLIL